MDLANGMVSISLARESVQVSACATLVQLTSDFDLRPFNTSRPSPRNYPLEHVDPAVSFVLLASRRNETSSLPDVISEWRRRHQTFWNVRTLCGLLEEATRAIWLVVWINRIHTPNTQIQARYDWLIYTAETSMGCNFQCFVPN